MQIPSLAQEGPLEKGMTTHSSILAWRIPWTEEAGGLQSMGSQRVSHDLSNLARMHAGTCLAVQWPRLCTSTAEVAGLIPSQGTEILHAAQRSQKERKNSNSSSFHWQNDCQIQMAAYMQKACFQPVIYLNLPVPFTCLYLKKKSQMFSFVNISATWLYNEKNQVFMTKINMSFIKKKRIYVREIKMVSSFL